MIHYRNPNDGMAYLLDEGQPVPDGWVLMSASEVDALNNPPPPVPPVVSMRQARLALLGAGLLDKVDAAIAALPSPQCEAAQIEWEYATEVRRDSALVAELGAGLGLGAEAIDQLFTIGATL